MLYIANTTAKDLSLINMEISEHSAHHANNLHDKSTISSQRCQCLAVLKGHSSYVSALAVFGSSLYSGSSDRHIRIWSTPYHSGCTHQVVDCKSAIRSLLISGGSLFTSHQDHKIRVWRIAQNHRLLTVLPTRTDRLLSFLSPGKHVEVRRHKTCTWVHHVDAVSGLAVSADGSLLYSVSWDRSLKAWRTSDLKCVESVANAHHDAINAVVVSNDGFVYTGSADSTVKVWKRLCSTAKHRHSLLATLEKQESTLCSAGKSRHSLVATLEKHESAVNALALSDDGAVLYSGAGDRSVVVWERGGSGGRHMTATGTLMGHSEAVLCVSTTDDFACSGSADRTVRVWRRGGDAAAGAYTCFAVLGLNGGPVKSLAVSRAETCENNHSTYFVYSGGMDCDVKVWRLSVPFA